VDVFAFVGIPFVVLLAAFTLVGNAIGDNAAGPDPVPSVPPARGLSGGGAAAAAAGGAFSHLTDESYAIEPAALLFALEAGVGLALAVVVALPNWSARRAWVLRAIGLYWLCVAGPALILADYGNGWISLTDQGSASLPLGLAPFPLEIIAAIVPAVLIWIASLDSRVAS
jgi:hypothetical protein